mmetsp:Transcript_22321/g.56973  ORF Transcript_22321/g.56973 Transcript_22321/m.56973 type:complete len:368 (+) Transcript_22321:517-1620(+)
MPDGTKAVSVANMSSVCFLKRCIDGEVKIESEMLSLKIFSACERMRSRDAGERNAEPAARKSQAPPLPSEPNADWGFVSFHRPRSASHDSPSDAFAAFFFLPGCPVPAPSTARPSSKPSKTANSSSSSSSWWASDFFLPPLPPPPPQSPPPRPPPRPPPAPTRPVSPRMPQSMPSSCLLPVSSCPKSIVGPDTELGCSSMPMSPQLADEGGGPLPMPLPKPWPYPPVGSGVWWPQAAAWAGSGPSSSSSAGSSSKPPKPSNSSSVAATPPAALPDAKLGTAPHPGPLGTAPPHAGVLGVYSRPSRCAASLAAHSSATGSISSWLSVPLTPHELLVWERLSSSSPRPTRLYVSFLAGVVLLPFASDGK